MATKKKNSSKKTENKIDDKKKKNVVKKEETKSNKKVEKESNKIEYIKGIFDEEMRHNIVIASCVIIFICLFYFLTIYITSKNSDADNTTNTEETSSIISYDEIMVGRSFSISDGEYIVFYYDNSDSEVSASCSELISNYNVKEDHLDLYTVDMSSGLNKSYAKDESNTNPTKASEIAINGPTVIRFNGNEVVDYIEGIDNITSYLE